MVQVVSRIEYFKCINFFDWLSIQHIPFDEYNNFEHFHLTIIAELFRGRSLLRNIYFAFNSFINK